MTKSHLPAIAKLTAVAIALLVAGCDSSDSNNAEQTPAPAPTPTPTPTPTPDPTPTPESTWDLVWSDEFDGSEIDATKWGFEVNCWGGGNNEQQCYTDRATNAFLTDGVLSIVAMREDFTGPNNPDGDLSNTATLPYTSARLRTMNKGDWKYGRFEIRAKLPAGQGTWPAIWMLPTDYVYGGWAASGEIDIMEAVNLKVDTDETGAEAGTPEARVHGTLHYGKAWPENASSGTEYHLPEGVNPADDFHTYAVEWEEGEIRWYVDDVHFATHQESGWYSQYEENGELVNGPSGAPFNQDFHLLLNLAVGGSWASNTNDKGIDESVFPQTMEVDFVRVYECSLSPETGAGCATIGEDAELIEGNAAPEIVVPDTSFGAGPVFNMYTDELAEGLVFNSYNPDSAVSYEQVSETDHGEVVSMVKSGANGNLYFEYAPHADLSHWAGNGELVFDLKVDSMDSGVELLVKMDSGWPNTSDYTVTLPTIGDWGEVRISVDALIAGGNRFSPGSAADLSDVVNVFVLEPLGVMSLKFDNVRLEYGISDADSVNVFTDGDNAPFAFGQYVASGSIDSSEKDLGGDHGVVREVTFNTDESVVFFQSSAGTMDVSAFTHVEFDLNVTTDPRATRDFNVKMDCVNPCGSGDFAITAPVIGEWTSYSIALADLVANTGSSLDLTKVDTPLVVFPAWGNQNGVVMQVDNVRLSKDGVSSAPTPSAPEVDLPISFDDSSVTYTVVDFGGTATTIVDDPMGSQGMVAMTIKTDSAASWAGTTMSNDDGFITVIPITASDSIMSVWVHSPAANIPVRLKLEDHNDSTRTVETESLTTVANTWEKLTFDFNNEVPDTEPLIHDDWTFDKASIFFNFGTEGADAGEQTYYWDDVVFGS